MMNNTQSAVAKAERTVWPDLSKNKRAMELAKVAMGWADMTAEQQMANLSALAIRANQIEGTL